MSGIRNVVFANNEIYHIFNRSVANEQIFVKKYDLHRALSLISFYRTEQSIRYSFFERFPITEKQIYLQKFSGQNPLVELYAYAFMPNHFHFLIKQLQDKGILKFLSNYQNGFAKYFNIKNKRHGPLFDKSFKAKHVATNEEFLHISRYIHLNPTTSYLITYDNLKLSNLTSYPFYFNNRHENFVNTKYILSIIGSVNAYEQFVANQVNYQRELNRIKHLLMD